MTDPTPRALYGALWTFVLLNMLFRDIHEALRPGFLEEVMTGAVNGTPLTEGLFLAAAITLQIPLLMVVLPHVLGERANRIANGASALLVAGLIVIADRNDLDDMAHAAFELAALAVIVALAWRPRFLPHGRRALP